MNLRRVICVAACILLLSPAFTMPAAAQGNDTISVMGTLVPSMTLTIGDDTCDMGEIPPGVNKKATWSCDSYYTVDANVEFWVSACAIDINPNAGLSLSNLSYGLFGTDDNRSAHDCDTDGFVAIVGPGVTEPGRWYRTLSLVVKVGIWDSTGEFTYAVRLLATAEAP